MVNTKKRKISWASPVVVNTGAQTEILIAADPDVSSYNPITGKENWKINCIFGEVGPSVGYSNGIVYAVNEYAKTSSNKKLVKHRRYFGKAMNIYQKYLVLLQRMTCYLWLPATGLLFVMTQKPVK